MVTMNLLEHAPQPIAHFLWINLIPLDKIQMTYTFWYTIYNF